MLPTTKNGAYFPKQSWCSPNVRLGNLPHLNGRLHPRLHPQSLQRRLQLEREGGSEQGNRRASCAVHRPHAGATQRLSAGASRPASIPPEPAPGQQHECSCTSIALVPVAARKSSKRPLHSAAHLLNHAAAAKQPPTCRQIAFITVASMPT